MKWISIKDKLPPPSVCQNILFYVKSGIYTMQLAGNFNINKGRFESHMISTTVDNVTHWMPLPDPPKE